jgi:hypothetical protein
MPEIHFQCPKCGRPLHVSEELANQLMECPTCIATIVIPARSRMQPPPVSRLSEPEQQAVESIFFQSGDITVTNARFVVGAETFAIRDIASVEVVESDKLVKRRPRNPLRGIVLMALQLLSGFFGLFFIFAGAVCWYSARLKLWEAAGCGVVGVLMIAVPGWPSANWKRAFKIVLKTAGSEKTVYKSFDRDRVFRIVRALNESIMSRG